MGSIDPLLKEFNFFNKKATRQASEFKSGRFLKPPFLFFLSLVLLFIAIPSLVYAEDGYSAKEVSRSFGTLHIKPGNAITFEIKYKNTGTKTWYRNSRNFLELVTAEPIKRQSVFQHDFWEKDFLVARIKEDSVVPGKVGTFRFALQAPLEEGMRLEKFKGVVKSLAWVDGMELTIPIDVSKTLPKPKIAVTPASLANGFVKESSAFEDFKSDVEIRDDDYSATLLIKSGRDIQVQGGEELSISIGFKNTGKYSWYRNSRNFVSFYTISPKYHESVFYDKDTWYEKNQVKIDTETVQPGEIGYFNFKIKVPIFPGKYIDYFHLSVENKTWIKGGVFDIPITVLPSGSNAVLISTSSSSEKNSLEVTRNVIIAEPLLRVGLYHTEEPVLIGASGSYDITDQDGTVLYKVLSGEVVKAWYDVSTKKYNVRYQNIDTQYDSYIRFVPQSDSSIMELVNYDDRPKWDTHLNYNRFSGSLELRYNDYKERVWVINELKMESYLKGLVETSNVSPLEYLKAMAIAARTYAMYHYIQDNKHVKEFFHLDAVYDQVYKGASAEYRSPMIAKAVDQSSGIMVTYNNEIVVTPYFTQTNGETLSWQSVWGGDKPWLVSVSDPYNQGKDMLGHGVGLSTMGALYMASRDGKTYDEILKHYYTGVAVERFY